MGCVESVVFDDTTCSSVSLMSCFESNSQPSIYEIDTSHFMFLQAIGAGGFGIVQCAKKLSEPGKGKIFAIKSLSKASILKRKSGLVSIFTELKILASIKHVFICNSYYAFQDEAYLYLVLDLAKGGDMRYNLSCNGGKFSEEKAKFYIAQVILALEYLHSIRIIHRDIKPENILLNDDGYIKLTDFGISKVLSIQNDCRSTSGTHGYMAPEIYIAPLYKHGCQADWFALGITMYELLMGQRPFDSKTLRNNQCLSELPMNNRVSNEISPECFHMLRGLLYVRPELRLCGSLYNGSNKQIVNRSNVLYESTYIRDQPWLKNMNWEMLYHRALPVPSIPDSLIIRSCLNPADAQIVLNQHRQAPMISDNDQVNFTKYAYRNKIPVMDAVETNCNQQCHYQAQPFNALPPASFSTSDSTSIVNIYNTTRCSPRSDENKQHSLQIPKLPNSKNYPQNKFNSPTGNTNDIQKQRQDRTNEVTSPSLSHIEQLSVSSHLNNNANISLNTFRKETSIIRRDKSCISFEEKHVCVSSSSLLSEDSVERTTPECDTPYLKHKCCFNNNSMFVSPSNNPRLYPLQEAYHMSVQLEEEEESGRDDGSDIDMIPRVIFSPNNQIKHETISSIENVRSIIFQSSGGTTERINRTPNDNRNRGSGVQMYQAKQFSVKDANTVKNSWNTTALSSAMQPSPTVSSSSLSSTSASRVNRSNCNYTSPVASTK